MPKVSKCKTKKGKDNAAPYAKISDDAVSVAKVDDVPAKTKASYSQKKLSAYQSFVAEKLRNDPNIKRLPNKKRLAAVSALWRAHKKSGK